MFSAVFILGGLSFILAVGDAVSIAAEYACQRFRGWLDERTR